MPEYIERAKAAEFFEKNKQVMWHKDDVAAAVSSKNIPAADVVEVVRCKDCKHSYDGIANLMCGRNGQNRNGMRLGGVSVKEEYFCSHGERKEDVNA